MANGDAAAALGWHTVAGTDDRRNGYDEINAALDKTANLQTSLPGSYVIQEGTTNAKISLGTDLVVTRDDGNAGQRFSLTGRTSAVMPYFQVVAATRTGTDLGNAVAGYQLHLGPDTGSGTNREFMFIEAVGENDVSIGPHFRMGTWASGTGTRRPFIIMNNTPALRFNVSDSAMYAYQILNFSGVTSPLRMTYAGPLTAFRAVATDTAGTDNTAQIALARTRGTVASPTAPTSSDTLGSILMGSFDTGFQTGTRIRTIAAENWAFGSAHGALLEFLATKSTTATLTAVARMVYPASASRTSLQIAVSRSGTVTTNNEVLIGAADSAGVGYRTLMIAN